MGGVPALLTKTRSSARLAIVRGEASKRLEQTRASRSRVALLGLSGSGKTELARQWFVSRPAKYAFRWWVRGYNRETLVNDLASLAPLLGLPTVRGELVETPEAKFGARYRWWARLEGLGDVCRSTEMG